MEGGRSGMGCGFGGRGRGQATGKQRLGRGAPREGGRPGGPNARSDRESGPGPGRGRASSVPLVTHFDARRTNQPAPHQLDSSTVDCAEGLRSVCLSVSVRLRRSIPFWPSLEIWQSVDKNRTAQHGLDQV